MFRICKELFDLFLWKNILVKAEYFLVWLEGIFSFGEQGLVKRVRSHHFTRFYHSSSTITGFKFQFIFSVLFFLPEGVLEEK